jgi:glycosyltransferase involved in cell wall biosynthesis
MLQKPTVLITNQYFYPGFKAGGPIQSIVQLIKHLHQQYNFAVYTSAFDLHEKQPYKTIQLNTWNTILIDDVQVKVWYQFGRTTVNAFKQVIQYVQPNFVYVNGLYDYNYCIIPFFLRTFLKQQQIQLVVSTRGMLQAGALQQKAIKKKFFIKLLQQLGWLHQINWHATDEQEKVDIQQYFSPKKISIASNIPKQPVGGVNEIYKNNGEILLAYLSIITPKKNLLLLLQALQYCKKQITLHIYGAIKEAAYWQQCTQLINELPKHITVQYKAPIEPHLVQTTLQQYHALVWPCFVRKFKCGPAHYY